MSPRPPSGRLPVTVKLDPAMVEWLDGAAAVRGVDRSERLRRLIAAHMSRPRVSVITVNRADSAATPEGWRSD
jgi:hypothetical protein